MQITIPISIDGVETRAEVREHLLDVINRAGVELPQVCYHPLLGPIQTCDTCIVAVDGNLVRACATVSESDMKVSMTVAAARAARTEAPDRIRQTHQLYCTVMTTTTATRRSYHGRAWVREANRLGMVINVSHASDDAISQAVDESSDPVVATHHGLRQVNEIPRNMPDWLMKKIAAKCGAIGFQIGNEFHNRKVFAWATQTCGEAFLGTDEIRQRGASLTILDIGSGGTEIDRR